MSWLDITKKNCDIEQEKIENKKEKKEEKIYNPYIISLRQIENKYDLKSSSVRDLRKSKIGKYMVFFRNLRSNLKKILFSDNYKYPL